MAKEQVFWRKHSSDIMRPLNLPDFASERNRVLLLFLIHGSRNTHHSSFNSSQYDAFKQGYIVIADFFVQAKILIHTNTVLDHIHT